MSTIVTNASHSIANTRFRHTLDFRVPVLLLIFLIAWCSRSTAAPAKPDFPGTGYPADLVVAAVPGTSNHLLTWSAYQGDFSVFGYDVYYGNEPANPGDNTGRINTGSTGGEWVDIDARTAGRCEPTAYFILAYSRGRKAYSDPARGTGANVCNEADTTAPEVTITQPVQGQEYTGSQLLIGTASDTGGSGVGSVTLTLIDDMGNETPYDAELSPGQWVWTSNLPEGSYTLTVFATDIAGNSSLSTYADFSVLPSVPDSTIPVISIHSPDADEIFLTAQQSMQGTIDDFGGSGVSSVQIQVSEAFADLVALEETVLTSGNNWSLNTALPDGDYLLTLNAADNAGNAADPQTRTFSVNRTAVIAEDGYADTASCTGLPNGVRSAVAPAIPASFENTFDSDDDIHQQLQTNWKSAYEWRQPTTDVIINKESQFYLDVLGFDKGLRDTWSPFELLKDGSANGYLAINAARTSLLNNEPSRPIVNGSAFAGQEYLSGVLTTFGTHSLAPSANGKVVIELKAKMPRGQGVFPAAWLYNESLLRNNPEIDMFEYIGQSPDNANAGSWLRPADSSCGPACVSAGRKNYDTYHTQYHNYYISDKGKLRGLGATSVDANGVNTGAIYTNPSAGTWWRNATWAGCTIDFSEKFHIYTMEWSSDEIVWYIDDIEVLRLDESADSSGNLPNVNFVPVDTRPMYLTLNFALGSVESYIGAPDEYTQNSMDTGDLKYVIDYIRVWQ